MAHTHSLGEDFAHWVELTDNYEAQIAHATEEDPSRHEDLAHMARRVREAGHLVRSWDQTIERSH